jgi:DNA primase
MNTSKQEKEALRLHANRNIIYLLDQMGLSYNDRGNCLLQSKCPAHQHGGDRNNHAAFSWRTDIGRWVCWSHHCEEKYGNDIFGLVSSILNIKFVDAINWISKKLEEKNIDITITDDIETSNNFQRDSFRVHEPLKEDHLKFLKPNLDFLLKRGFSKLVLQDYQTGLWQRPGTPMDDRIVFPIRDHEGFLVGYTGRTIHPESYFTSKGLEYKKWLHGRYLNKWSGGELFTGSILFNLYRAKRFINESKSIILVEGPLDGMKLEMANIHNWVATLGTNFCYSHRTLLVKYGVTNLYVAYDNDMPKGEQNRKAGDEGWKRLQRIVGDLFHLHKVELPLGKDCGDLSIEELQKIFIS